MNIVFSFLARIFGRRRGHVSVMRVGLGCEVLCPRELAPSRARTCQISLGHEVLCDRDLQ